MSIFEYDTEKHIELERADAKAEGIKAGIEQGIEQTTLRFIMKLNDMGLYIERKGEATNLGCDEVEGILSAYLR